MYWLKDHVPSLVLAGVSMLVTFLVKHYFDRLHQDIARVGNSVAKLDGKLETLQAEIRSNTLEMARATAELKALWRWVDAPARATDNGGSHP